jgi:predicted nucleic acid-binding protein
LYLDTSVLVAVIANEPASTRVDAWLRQQSSMALAISDWVTAEFSAALSIKLRMGTMTLEKRAAALVWMARMSRDSFMVLPVSSACFSMAAHFADNYITSLRAADALHLAICAENGLKLYTLDQGLAAAGPPLGVPTQIL